MSDKGTVRYDKGCGRYYVDIYWGGRNHHIFKYLGVHAFTDRESCERILLTWCPLEDAPEKGDKNV